MVNIEGMTAEQIAEIEALTNKATELEEKNTTLGDKIYSLKKENKQEKDKIIAPTGITKEDVIALNKEMAFEIANPDLVKDETFKAYTSKGYGFEDAKILVEAKDPTIAARQKTHNSNFTTGVPNYETSNFTQEEVSKLPFNERKAIMAKLAKGEVTIK